VETLNKLKDNFYDTKDHSYGQKNHYIRERGGKLVLQKCGTKEGMLIYTEEEIEALPDDCNAFLSYSFDRKIKTGDNGDSYLDEIEIEGEDTYRMLTISRRVVTNNNSDITMEVLGTLVATLLEWELLPHGTELLDIYKHITNSPKYLLMPTKFMTMLQLSENADKYLLYYNNYDPFYKANHLEHLRQLVKEDEKMATEYYWTAFTRMSLFFCSI